RVVAEADLICALRDPGQAVRVVVGVAYRRLPRDGLTRHAPRRVVTVADRPLRSRLRPRPREVVVSARDRTRRAVHGLRGASVGVERVTDAALVARHTAVNGRPEADEG